MIQNSNSSETNLQQKKKKKISSTQPPENKKRNKILISEERKTQKKNKKVTFLPSRERFFKKLFHRFLFTEDLKPSHCSGFFLFLLTSRGRWIFMIQVCPSLVLPGNNHPELLVMQRWGGISWGCFFFFFLQIFFTRSTQCQINN